MNLVEITGALVALASLFRLIGLYNSLVSARNACDESWADIETELARRHDLIPNLVETAAGYATHERVALQEVIGARNAAATSRGSLTEKVDAERELDGKLRGLFVLVERYPNLKANASFQKLHAELTNSEDRVQRARRFYNANVRVLADRLEMFPSNLIATLFSLEAMEYFEPGEQVIAAAVEVKLGVGR